MGMRPQRRKPGAAGTGWRRERPRRSGRRRLLVAAIQVALLAAFLGAWQLAADASSNNKFLYGSPSGIWNQLDSWVHTGTTEGPLWAQIWITLQETLLGFGIGVVLGVVFGILLGRIQLLAEIFGVYIGTFN